jgi:D-alanyl-D-alanine dipeptidase
MNAIFFSLCTSLCLSTAAQESGFAYLDAEIPNIVLETRYATTENFTGRVVPGYASFRQVLTKEAIAALKQVQAELNQDGLGLKVYDAYRPQRAVDSFMAWCANEADTLKKAEYYPDVAKKDIIPSGYIWTKSGHSRGSTLDLTIVNLETGEELDMGTSWDFFGHESWIDYAGITEQQKANRQLLAEVMKKHGFKGIREEWWHFTLVNEPFPDTYFDFVVE